MQNQVSGFPLSLQQRQLWRLRNESTAFRAQCVVLLKRNLNKKILVETVKAVIKRHEILRTTFRQIPGLKYPIQIITEDSSIELEEIDLTALDSHEQQPAVEEVIRQKRNLHFDYERCPLLQLSLLALAPDEHMLAFTLPAFCADTQTLDNLVTDISRLYEDFAQGRRSTLDEPMQFIQFSEWQNALLRDEEAAPGKEYWRKLLAAANHNGVLPYENNFAGARSFDPAQLELSLDSDVVTTMDATLQRYDVCTADILLACWHLLLWRLTGNAEVFVNCVFDGRKYEELRSAAGLFARSLPIHCSLDEESRFSQVVAKIADARREAEGWQEYFTPEQDTEVDSDNAPESIYSYGFEYHACPAPDAAAGVTFSIHSQYVCFDRFKIKLNCTRRGNSLTAELLYDRNLFSHADIERLGEQFKTLLKSGSEKPEVAIRELEVVGKLERQLLLVEWNDTDAAYPRTACVHELFEDQARCQPKQIAVEFEGNGLTYGELNDRANQVANHLRRLGVAAEVRVGILMERSLEMIVGLWGVLKAGGAYVPLDPTLPEARLSFILEDAGVQLVLSQEKLSHRLSGSRATMICLDSDWQRIATESTTNPVNKTVPENLVYVIYTSGSTGRPKGVMISHQGLVNYLSWCGREYAVTEGKGTLVHSPLGFDLTVTSLLCPLLAGQRVVLLAERPEIESLRETLRAGADFSLIKITPAHLELLSHTTPSEVQGWARALIIGGDALFGENLSFWRNHAPATRLINEYGPTETVVGCCVFESPQGEIPSGAVPIGKPIANTQLYVLDERQQLVPVGLPGELYISGDGLGRGYLNHPGLTAQNFVPHPFSTKAGARLYRTGDIARYLPDGNLEYVGRADHQVKIRGFRIELGEIEAAVVQHPLIHEAVVIASEDQPGSKRLVVYCVPRAQNASSQMQNGHHLSPDSLRDYLQKELPDYMVPSEFVMLETLPLTANGKVDRHALPSLDGKRSGSAEPFVAPRDILELRLAQIWEEILDRRPIGVRDDFFKLGGHSILAARLMARIQQLLGINLPLATLFQKATIEFLAGLLRRQEESAICFSSLVKIQSGGSNPPFFCVHPGGGNILCYVGLARHLGLEQAFYGLQAWGLHEANVAHTTIEEMATSYLKDIRAVQPSGPYFLGGLSIGGVLAFEIAQQIERQGEQVGLLALLDSKAPAPGPDISEIAELLLMEAFSQDLGLDLDHLKFSHHEFERLRPDEQLRYLFECAQASNIMPPDIELNQVQHMYQIFKINIGAVLSYRPQSKVRRITVFRAGEHPEHAHTAGWTAFATEGVDVYVVPGNHFSMVREPFVKTLASQLRACLDAAFEEPQ